MLGFMVRIFLLYREGVINLGLLVLALKKDSTSP